MTSEERFELPEQPSETCPMINDVNKKINLIEKLVYRYNDNDKDELKERLCEIDYCASGLIDKMEEIRKHVESIRVCGESWKNKAIDLNSELEPFICKHDGE